MNLKTLITSIDGIIIKAKKLVLIEDWVIFVAVLVTLSLVALLIYLEYPYYPYIPYISLASIILCLGIVIYQIYSEVVPQKIKKKGGGVRLVSIREEEKWHSIAVDLDNIYKRSLDIEKESANIRKNISYIFNNHRQLKDKYMENLRQIIDVYIFATKLKKVPEEYVEPFKSKIWSILEKCGVKEWIPEVGKPPPDGCDKIEISEEYPYDEGTVAKVVIPGYITAEGEIIRPPLVEVVKKINNNLTGCKETKIVKKKILNKK